MDRQREGSPQSRVEVLRRALAEIDEAYLAEYPHRGNAHWPLDCDAYADVDDPTTNDSAYEWHHLCGGAPRVTKSSECIAEPACEPQAIYDFEAGLSNCGCPVKVSVAVHRLVQDALAVSSPGIAFQPEATVARFEATLAAIVDEIARVGDISQYAHYDCPAYADSPDRNPDLYKWAHTCGGVEEALDWPECEEDGAACTPEPFYDWDFAVTICTCWVGFAWRMRAIVARALDGAAAPSA